MRHSILFLSIVLLYSCAELTARRPINPKPSTTLLSDYIEENKELNTIENKKITQLIKSDSTKVYQVSSEGFWYRYIKKVNEENQKPIQGNEVTFEYEIRDLNNTTIYSKEELGLRTYKVDKEDFIPAIQQGIKLMKLGETITFVIPSYSAFGIAGDGNRIGINQSIISTVTLINIK
jgi:gliding motility-associated peptidyl-prolyl isomerase